MRPVEKGRNTKVFKAYTDAKPDLQEALGSYCSYCEAHLETGLAVEHIRPKSHYPKLCLSWSNFLLACGRCNSRKGTRDVVLEDYFWPDRDDTFSIFVYKNNARIEVAPGLDSTTTTKATNLLGLVKLDEIKDKEGKFERRFQQRQNVWREASEAKDDLGVEDTEGLRKTIVKLACAKGHWSIWMTVFADDEDMCRRICERFPGTRPIIQEKFNAKRAAEKSPSRSD